MSDVRCPRCGGTNESTAAFCGTCGTPLPSQLPQPPVAPTDQPPPQAWQPPAPSQPPAGAYAAPPPGAIPAPPGVYPQPPSVYPPPLPPGGYYPPHPGGYPPSSNAFSSPPQPPVPLLHIGFERKLRALAFCWLANVALNIVILWVGYEHWDETPENIRFITGLIIFAAWAGVLSGLIAAIGLLNRQTWGRIASIIAAVIALVNLIEFPVGTAIGIWTLVVLLNAQNSAAYKGLSGSAR